MTAMEMLASLKSNFWSIVLAITSIISNVEVGYCQTTRATATTWNTGASWNGNSVPATSGTVEVNHALSLDVAINCEGGVYTINSKITDPTGGINVPLVIGKNGPAPNTSKVYINATSIFGGDLLLNSSGALYIAANDTLIIGNAIFEKGSILQVAVGGVLIINGNITNKNQSDDILVNGTLIASGNISASNNSVIAGNGNVSAGSFSGDGLIMGMAASQISCPVSGPCSICNNIISNNIIGTQSICAGNEITTIGGSAALVNSGTPMYAWQSSTDNATWTSTSYTTQDLPTNILLTTTISFRRIATANGCSNTSTSVTVTVNPNNNWIGGNASWNTASNWSCGNEPKTTQNVIISNGTPYINITSPSPYVYAKDLTIGSGAGLQFSNVNSILRIYGNFSNAGRLVNNGIGTVELTGSNPHIIAGTNNFNNLTISGNTTITSGISNQQMVRGVLTLKADLATNDNLTIDLDSGLIAPATSLPTTHKIIGNIKVKRKISGYANHYISSPLGLGSISSSIPTASQLEDNTSIQYSISPNLFSYDETKKSATLAHAPWIPITSGTTELEPTKGYSLYTFGDANIDFVGTYDHNKEVAAPINLSFTPNAAGYGGWNLIGNPFPGPLDWEAAGWNRTGMDNAVYLYNGTTKKYSIYIQTPGVYGNTFTNVINGGSRYIPAMQAFLVKRTSKDVPASLTMNNSVRKNSFPYAAGEKSFYRQEAEVGQVLKLTAQSGTNSEETLIRFFPEATDSFDPQMDANSMGSSGETPSLYTFVGDTTYDINSLAMTHQSKEVNVGLTARFAGEYSIKAEEILPFNYTRILLLDKQTGHVQDLRSETEYKFFSEKGSFTQRFKLMFSPETITSMKNQLNNKLHVSSNTEGLTLFFDNITTQSASIKIMDVTGRIIYTNNQSEINDGKCFISSNQLPQGCLLLNVITGEEIFSSTVLNK